MEIHIEVEGESTPRITVRGGAQKSSVPGVSVEVERCPDDEPSVQCAPGFVYRFMVPESGWGRVQARILVARVPVSGNFAATNTEWRAQREKGGRWRRGTTETRWAMKRGRRSRTWFEVGVEDIQQRVRDIETADRVRRLAGQGKEGAWDSKNRQDLVQLADARDVGRRLELLLDD